MTGRRTLTNSAYADDRHLRARQAIWTFVDEPVDPTWRLGAIDWDGTQRVVDVGCGNGLDLAQLVPTGLCARAIGVDLSAGMLAGLDTLAAAGRLSRVQGDVQCLPLRDDCADVALAMHMLYHVANLDAAVRELRRVTVGGGTLLASTNAAGTLAEIHELFDAVLTEHLGRPAHSLPELGFTTESGAAWLARGFDDVALVAREVTLSIPTSAPVRAYLDSVREPILAHVGPFDFDAVLDEFTRRVENQISALGRFRAVGRSGVFVAR